MPSSENRNIEKLIRAFAQRRRDSYGHAEMPASTRAKLHSEISRMYHKRAQPAFSPLTRLLLRWALACAFFAIISLTALFLLNTDNGGDDFTIAGKTKRAVPEESVKSIQSRTTSAPKQQSSVETDKPKSPMREGERRTQTRSFESKYADSRARALEQFEPSLTPRKPEQPADSLTASKSNKPQPTAPATMKEEQSLALAAAPVEHENTVSNKRRLAGGAAQLPSGSQKMLLSRFNLKRTGREIRIVDSDGSVYIGTIPATDAKLGRRITDIDSFEFEKGVDIARDESGVSNYREIPFTATGTNNTLNEAIFLEAKLLIPDTISSIDNYLFFGVKAGRDDSVTATGGVESAVSNGKIAVPLLIEGRVTVDKTNTYDFTATSIPESTTED
ncbi:MAG: hypothetical protein K9N48_01360 [Verrucomicrobia bacterium]|nr:hypothetical protein [Verrucomicrobiota bacterium]MCF7707300.1 hypothetical protein [Verrucomicrobiota bacterium]